MCLNDMIMHYPGDIHHICSLDAPMLPKWWAARRPPYKAMFPSIPRVHTVEYVDSSNHRKFDELPEKAEIHPFQGGGTSGLFACFVGLSLGYEEITLAGIPIDNSGHYWEAPWGKTNFQREIANSDGQIRGDGRRYWAKAAEKFQGKVKSLSGYTRKLLGEPVGYQRREEVHIRTCPEDGRKLHKRGSPWY